MSSNEWLTDMQKIGVGLTAFGFLFTILGILLLFDGGFLAMGNILFLVGVTLVVGAQKAYEFFFQKRKWKGTVSFFLGIALVFLRWPKIGIVIEAFGFANLFGDFFPTAIRFVRRVPVIGTLFNLPLIRPKPEERSMLG